MGDGSRKSFEAGFHIPGKQVHHVVAEAVDARGHVYGQNHQRGQAAARDLARKEKLGNSANGDSSPVSGLDGAMLRLSILTRVSSAAPTTFPAAYVSQRAHDQC
ncbi:hypothetical protein PMIN03_001810 [Paraphaeosphaeria minitans]